MLDLISREAAIAAIEAEEESTRLSMKGLDIADQTINRAVCLGLEHAVLEISNVPPASGWISVKKRLPEFGQRALIWHCAEYEPLSKGTVELGTYKPGEIFGEKYAWRCAEYELPLEDVTHWQPLPAPPTD